MDVDARHGDRRAERGERRATIADGVSHHFGDFPSERALPSLHALMREDVVLEHEVVGDRHRNDDEIGPVGAQCGVEQSGFRRLQLAAVAPAAFRVEEEIVLLEDFGDIRLQRDQVRGILGVAPDRDGAGDVLVDQAERSAEQVDAGGDQRRTDAVVVEDERLDQIVGVALVIRRVDDAVRAHRRR